MSLSGPEIHVPPAECWSKPGPETPDFKLNPGSTGWDRQRHFGTTPTEVRAGSFLFARQSEILCLFKKLSLNGNEQTAPEPVLCVDRHNVLSELSRAGENRWEFAAKH